MKANTCIFCNDDTRSHFMSVCMPCLFTKGNRDIPKEALRMRMFPRVLFRPARLAGFLERRSVPRLVEEFGLAEMLTDPLLLNIKYNSHITIKVCEQVKKELGTQAERKDYAAGTRLITPEKVVEAGGNTKWRLATDRLLTSYAENTGNKCVYCAADLGRKYEMDSVVPLWMDHSHCAARLNHFYHRIMLTSGAGVVACAVCNRTKGANEGRGVRLLHALMKGQWSVATERAMNRLRDDQPSLIAKTPFDISYTDQDDSEPIGDETCSDQHEVMLRQRLTWLGLRVVSVCRHFPTIMVCHWYPHARTLAFTCPLCETYQNPLFAPLPEGCVKILAMSRPVSAAKKEAGTALASAKSDVRKKAARLAKKGNNMGVDTVTTAENTPEDDPRIER